MNKRAIIKKIVARLTEELQVYFRAAQFSRAEATHESSKAESKYDTRGLEASYLARGQSKQAAEIEAAIAEFEKLAQLDQDWRDHFAATNIPMRQSAEDDEKRQFMFESIVAATSRQGIGMIEVDGLEPDTSGVGCWREVFCLSTDD